MRHARIRSRLDELAVADPRGDERRGALARAGGHAVTQALARIDISHLSMEELRAIATRNLVECCDEWRATLREQLERTEFVEPAMP